MGMGAIHHPPLPSRWLLVGCLKYHTTHPPKNPCDSFLSITKIALPTHELFCHTLGNLTLTAYNPELSNSTFDQKKEYFRNSHLELNKYFQCKTSWRREDIEERAKYLANIALQIWSYFGHESVQPSQPSIVKPSNITGTTPKSLRFLGQEYNVKSWRDVMKTTLNIIAESEPDAFEEVMKQFPRFVGWDEKDFRSTRQLSNGAFIEVNLSASDIYTFCMRAIETVGLSTDEWDVEIQESDAGDCSIAIV